MRVVASIYYLLMKFPTLGDTGCVQGWYNSKDYYNKSVKGFRNRMELKFNKVAEDVEKSKNEK